MSRWVKALIVLAVLAGITWAYMSWLNGRLAERFDAGKAVVQGLWDKDTQARQAVAITAGENFRKQELREAARSSEIEHESRKNEKAVADARTRAADASSRLLGHIAASNAAARGRGLPTAASCPAEFARQRDAAIFARELLGQCGSRYQALAAATDGIRLKLDTSMKFVSVISSGSGATAPEVVKPERP